MNSSNKALLIAVIIYYANMHCMEELPGMKELLNFNVINLLTNFTRIIPDGMEELRKKEKQIRAKEKQIFCEGLFKLIAQYITILKTEKDFLGCTKECQEERQALFNRSIRSGYKVLEDIEKWPIKTTFYIDTEEKKENISPAIFNPLPFNVICSCLNLINEYINSKEKRLILLPNKSLDESCKKGECEKKINEYKEKIFAFIIEKEKQKEIIKSLEKKNHLSNIVVNTWYEHEKDKFLNIIKPNITFLLEIISYVKKNEMICKEYDELFYKKITILDEIIQKNSRIREGKLSSEVTAFINNRENFLNTLFLGELKKDGLLIMLSIIKQTKQLDSNDNFNKFRQFNM